MTSVGVKLPSAGDAPCKICGGAAPLLGVVDFNKSCEEKRGKFLPLMGIPVYYRRCGQCGFVFTEAFDDWPREAFLHHIYNEGYAAVDPDYREARPKGSARIISNMFRAQAKQLSVVDYGGGSGVLARQLAEVYGFGRAVAYDPFVPEFARLPEGRFDLVTSYETIEHSPDPLRTVTEMAGLAGDDSAVVFSTLLTPTGELQRQDLIGWWYIGPRNGHVSIFSRQALAHVWGRVGFVCGSFNEDLHIAYRKMPGWARHLMASS